MPDERAIADRLWFGETLTARGARVALLPASWAFRAVVAARALAYRSGVMRSHGSGVPVASVGNLTVGGTGKTPVAAWLAGELLRRGAMPAVVLRGVGNDETEVHRRLNPGVAVIASPDRLAGIAQARAAGADVVVLDDAFQHRRAARDVDIVLVSADAWTRPRHMLPAGAWREPLGALRRASLAIVTRKAATDAAVGAAMRAIARTAPSLPTAVLRLESAALRRLDDDAAEQPLASLERKEVFAIAGIADPSAFLAQVANAGPESVEGATFADHHAFTPEEAARLARRARGADVVVSTLKDAVKLTPLWPRAGAPLWYVSQRVVVETGRERLDALLVDLLRRRGHPPSGRAQPDAVSQPS